MRRREVRRVSHGGTVARRLDPEFRNRRSEENTQSWGSKHRDLTPVPPCLRARQGSMVRPLRPLRAPVKSGRSSAKTRRSDCPNRGGELRSSIRVVGLDPKPSLTSEHSRAFASISGKKSGPKRSEFGFPILNPFHAEARRRRVGVCDPAFTGPRMSIFTAFSQIPFFGDWKSGRIS